MSVCESEREKEEVCVFWYIVVVCQAPPPPPQRYLCIRRHMLVGTNYYTSNQSSLAM